MTPETELSETAPNEIRLRGFPIEELMAGVPFADAVWLLLSGEIPDDAESELFSAVLTACLDHGLTPPSTQATRIATSGGATVPAATAAGMLAIGDHHGGAMLECQTVLEFIVERANDQEEIQAVAARTVDEYLDADDRMPGYGHRYHGPDPRGVRLVELLETHDYDGEYTTALRAVGNELDERVTTEIHPNVDGAIAAVLGELGIDPAVSQAVFVIGRTAGLTAHSYEERIREAPMRKTGPIPDEITYTGPAPRSLDR